LAVSQGRNTFYILALNKNQYIDARLTGNDSRFINHSCDPNCETKKWVINGETRIGIFAVKDIPPGTELTYDYQWEHFEGSETVCHCGSENCTGTFNASKRKRKE